MGKLICATAVLMIGVVWSGRAAAVEGEKKPSRTIAQISISGSIPEGVGQGGALSDVSPRLHRIVERIDQAAADPRVKGVLLTIASPDIGRGRMEEVAAAVARVRKAGKPVAAHFVSGGPVPYSLAAACDTISMPPAATLEITGVRMEVTFFKAMLDTLGVDAEILQVGDFKGAGEPLTRTSMSPQLRAQYEQFVGDLYEQLVERVASTRGLTADRARELVDRGVFTPEAAMEAELIDAVAYEDEVISGLASQLDIDEPTIARNYAAKEVDNDFSGIGGMVKLLEMFSGGGKKAVKGREKRVAIVHLTGEIREGKGSEGLLGSGGGGTDAVIKAIREAANDATVAAIVLRIDSPGGSALASDLIWREAERIDKPVVASLSDTAASGGYYVAVAADRIVAAPGTLTGSIGVVGGKIAVGEALDKVGVHTDVVSKGRNAGWLSMQTPFTDDEREAFLTTMKDVYRLFTSKVADGRHLDRQKLATLAEGRVFTGRMAKELGLVDRLGTLDDAVDEARQLAGLAADEKLERILLPEPRGLFEDLFGQAEVTAAPVAKAAVRTFFADLPGVDAFVEHLDALSLVTSGRPLMMLPARIHVR
jgi:protease-4